jgi:type IV secretion system protein TrbG
MRLLLGLFAVSLPLQVLAQNVPAIDTTDIKATYMPSGYMASTVATTTAIPTLSSDTVRLNSKEQQAVSLSTQWKNNPTAPFRGADGIVTFVYGVTQPSIVCEPLTIADLALQPGEIVNQVSVGDSPRWNVKPATSGTGESAITHLVIKPADVGLTTNMIVHTNRRTYNIRLISKKNATTPLVAFSYPDDTQAAWANYKREHQQQEPIKATVQREASPTVAHSTLDFNYDLKGDSPVWKPIRVYSDTNKTFIQFPDAAKNTEIPALVMLGADHQTKLVNYRLVDDRFVVDSLIDRAALITGVGRHQQRVEIVRGH